MSAVLDVLSWLFLGAGSLVLVAGAVAILRMPTFYTRIHAASVNEALGPALVIAGLLLQAEGRFEPTIKLLLVLVFLVFTGPLSAHALAKSAYQGGLRPSAESQRPGDAGAAYGPSDANDAEGEGRP